MVAALLAGATWMGAAVAVDVVDADAGDTTAARAAVLLVASLLAVPGTMPAVYAVAVDSAAAVTTACWVASAVALLVALDEVAGLTVVARAVVADAPVDDAGAATVARAVVVDVASAVAVCEPMDVPTAVADPAPVEAEGLIRVTLTVPDPPEAAPS